MVSHLRHRLTDRCHTMKHRCSFCASNSRLAATDQRDMSVVFATPVTGPPLFDSFSSSFVPCFAFALYFGQLHLLFAATTGFTQLEVMKRCAAAIRRRKPTATWHFDINHKMRTRVISGSLGETQCFRKVWCCASYFWSWHSLLCIWGLVMRGLLYLSILTSCWLHPFNMFTTIMDNIVASLNKLIICEDFTKMPKKTSTSSFHPTATPTAQAKFVWKMEWRFGAIPAARTQIR